MASSVDSIIDRMVADGRPPEEIEGFVRWAAGESARANAGRAKRIEDVERENSLGQIAKDTVTGSAKALWGGAKKLGEIGLGHAPVGSLISPDSAKAADQILTDPATRRETGRGLSDWFFGVPAKISDAIRKATGGQATYAENEEADAQAPQAQDYRTAAGLSGVLVPGSGTNAAGRVSLDVARRALPSVRPAIRAAAVAPVMAAAAGGAAGGVEGAIAGATDPLNALSLVGLGTERVLRTNPTLNRYAQSMDNGQLAASRRLPGGTAGVQRAAEGGLQQILRRAAQMDDQASQAYRQGTEPHMNNPVDADALRMRLLEGRQANIDPDSGSPFRDDVDKAFNRAFDRTPENPTVRGTLGRRRAMQQEAAYGSPNPTEAQAANREVYQSFREAVRAASPEVAAADDAYSAHAKKAARRNDVLWNTEDNVIPSGNAHPDALPIDYADSPTPAEGRPRVGKERSAVATLSRIDDDNVPGQRAARYLEELADQDPVFRQALDFIAAKKADVATDFSLKGLKPESLTGATAVVGPALRQNARAIGAQGLHLARGAQGPRALNLNILAQMAREDAERKRQENERMAKTLKAGGRR